MHSWHADNIVDERFGPRHGIDEQSRGRRVFTATFVALVCYALF